MPLIVTDQLGNPYTYVWNTVSQEFDLTPALGLTPSTNDNSISQSAMALIASAMRLIGVLASGETPQLSEANDALSVLNQMLDSWNADRLSVYTTTASDFALVQGKQTYTLGSGGFWDTNRPAKIDAMSVILTSNPSNPIEIPIPMYSVDDWQTKVPVKSVNGSFPTVCYDDGGFPLRTLSMWPIPTQVNNFRIYAWQPLPILVNLQSTVTYPPGYAEGLRYNLAVRLGAEFGEEVAPIVQSIALSSLARLKTMNAPDLKLQSDLSPGPAGYNYRADMFGLPY